MPPLCAKLDSDAGMPPLCAKLDSDPNSSKLTVAVLFLQDEQAIRQSVRTVQTVSEDGKLQCLVNHQHACGQMVGHRPYKDCTQTVIGFFLLAQSSASHESQSAMFHVIP